MTRSGVSMAAAFARGESTAVSTVETSMAAAEADTTNAFTGLDDHAMERAASLDEARNAGADLGPMAGVPIAVKDIIDHAGRVTTAGSAFHRHTAEATAPALGRLEAAGAVVVGRTGLHEFAFGFSSENPWFGPVLNPWDGDLSPGGSSGGSAAAVAAGIVPVALGSDTGGSIRVPAALCAVAGLKVTHGLIPLAGVFPLVPSLDTVGAIASSLDDLELATRLMAGVPANQWESKEDASSLHLVVPRAWVDSAPMSPEVAESFEEFLAAAVRVGLAVESRDIDDLGPSPHQAAIIGPEVAAIHRESRRKGMPFGADVGERIDAALGVGPEEIEHGRRWQATLTNSMRAATSEGSVLVTPTVGSMDKRIGVDMIGDRHYRTVLSWFTAPVNATGCPAVSVPLAGSGRRPSIQLIGWRRSEPRLLAVARILEERRLVDVNLASSRG